MKKPVDIVFKIDENEWNGEKSLQLRIIDLRLPNLADQHENRLEIYIILFLSTHTWNTMDGLLYFMTIFAAPLNTEQDLLFLLN